MFTVTLILCIQLWWNGCCICYGTKNCISLLSLHVGNKLNCARLLNQTPKVNDSTTVSEQTAVT